MPQVLCPVVVGRDAELATLETTIALAAGGEGGTIVITGEPGVGKSRLAREGVTLARGRGMRVVTGRAVPSSTASPYRPLLEATAQLADWLVVAEDLEGEPAAAIVRGEALLELLEASAAGGVLLVFEDLHWADPDTVAVLEYVADHLGDRAVAVLWTLRDGTRSLALDAARRLRGRSGVVHLALDRLAERYVTEMIRACLPATGRDTGQDTDALLNRVRAAAEGIPLLVEELLASPGLPASFTDTVRERLAGLDPDARSILEAAAVLGRHFDWELLPAICGTTSATVADALASGVDSLLLTAEAGSFRFRHALTREAVLDAMLPPAQRAVAAAALDAFVAAHPHLAAEERETAIDLALRAGERHRAGCYLRDTGQDALGLGALATAIDALRRAADLLDGALDQPEVQVRLIEALALTGRVEEAAAELARLVSRLGEDQAALDVRVEAHLRLAQAAVAASRWPLASNQLDEARRLANPGTRPVTTAIRARLAVLDAEVAFAADAVDRARGLAESVLGLDSAPPEVRCHAFEIVGRALRFTDLWAAREVFERGLICAETAGLPLWRLRALHELGTIDMFDHAGVERLVDARQAAEAMGALSTMATLDLQLSACFTCRWELDRADDHARSAIALAERFGWHQVRAKGLAFLSGTASMRPDLPATESWMARSMAARPGDRMLEGFGWAFRGMGWLLAGDDQRSLELWARGADMLNRLPHAEPASARALWPVVLAARADPRAKRAIDDARKAGVHSFHLNRALIAYAEAILTARAGDPQRAGRLIADVESGFANASAWAHLARFLAAPAARTDGWGEPQRWLADARETFTEKGLVVLAGRCDDLAAAPPTTSSNAWPGAGLTAREADVLSLIVQGLANKEIATRLGVSPRTAEKHVESLLRKTGAKSRTELIAATLRTT